MKSLLLAAAAALSLGFSATAAAGDMKQLGLVGYWRIEADETLCRASARGDDGSIIMFGINSQGGASMALFDARWDIPGRDDYQITMQVDRSPAETITAAAVGRMAVWAIPLTEASVNLLSYGRVIYVTVGRWKYGFNLIRSGAMLKALAGCAGERMAAANPFAGTQSLPASSNPFAGN